MVGDRFRIQPATFQVVTNSRFDHSSSPLQPDQQVAVVGAGIVGACIALTLQRAGLKVSLFDKDTPGSGTSFGNAGLISVDSCIPVALSGVLRQMPKWLLDPNGPVTIRARDVPRMMPWLLRKLRETSRDRVRDCSVAMRALHAPALELYRELLGERFDSLIETRGHLHVWDTDVVSPGEATENAVRENLQIDAQALSRNQVDAIVPGLGASVRRGLFFPRHAHAVNPQHLVQTIVDLFIQAGGTFIRAEITSIAASSQRCRQLVTAAQRYDFDGVVLATGIWANQLLGDAGVSIPLLAERGYHLRMVAPKNMPLIPVVHKARGIVLTPMADELRITGFVELAAHESPPNQRKIRALHHHSKAVFPDLLIDANAQSWVGSRPSTPDNLPVIDVLSQSNIFIACAHSHFGLTGAGMTAQLIKRLTLGESPGIDLAPYRLSRFH